MPGKLFLRGREKGWVLPKIEKREFSVHITVLFWGFGGFQKAKNTTNIGKHVNFVKFRKMPPPPSKKGV